MRVLAFLAVGLWALPAPPQWLEVAIVNGRVMDPASGLDGVRNVGIEGGRIVAVAGKRVHAKVILDATGLVVAPGFIVRRRVERGLEWGAVGVGLVVSYTPGATPFEVLEMFRAAARFPGAAVHAHVRELKESQYWLETDEVLADSLITGAPLHIVHVNSSYGRAAST